MKSLRDELLELCSIQDSITHLNENSAAGDDLLQLRVEQMKRTEKIAAICEWIEFEGGSISKNLATVTAELSALRAAAYTLYSADALDIQHTFGEQDSLWEARETMIEELRKQRMLVKKEMSAVRGE